jgi:hypothetical protein
VGVIAYYVHHQGSGHLHRAGAIAAHLRSGVTVLSSLPPQSGLDWVRLPRDDDAAGSDPTAGGTLHWAPLQHNGFRDRMAMISQWIAQARPQLAVVDVSVEVTMLFRLHGVPVVVVGMPGDRSDRPHRLAYDAATAILAPWAAEFARDWPEPWLDKTFHAGSISRFDGCSTATGRQRPGSVLLLHGSGGHPTTTPGTDSASWTWSVAHDLDAAGVLRRLEQAEVVVTHAGQNAVAEIAAVGRPAVVVPGDRPHGEQLDTAAVLERAGIAVVARRPPPDFDGLLQRAVDLGAEGWRRWRAGGGAPAAAAFLESLAR